MASSQAAPSPVLFMTSSEYGQENVVLATALEVARNPSFRVHFAAFHRSQSRVEAMNKECRFLAAPITYHKIHGRTLAESLTSSVMDYTHPPGFFNAIKSYPKFARLLYSCTPAEYLATYQSCVQIIRDVRPVALVVESLSTYARDAAKTLELEYIIIAPCGAKEVVGSELPGAPVIFKWPLASTGYQYPLSFVSRAKNIALSLVSVFVMMSSTTFREINKARKEAKIKGPYSYLHEYVKEGVQYILPFLLETDYANFRDYHLPPNILACGPITFPSLQPMQDCDAELLQWIQKRPTILVNLGSHFEFDAGSALVMSKALKFVLESRTDIQILWKLKFDLASSSEANPIIRSFTDSGRLRITPWLNTPPSVLVDTGYVMCSVHHGGANSYYEACKGGIPQLVLPIWVDTYEYAERARHLGIGLIGNVGVAPRVESMQMGLKLLQVINDETIKKRAEEVGAACKRRGEGREIAAAEIIQWAQKRRSQSKDLL